MNLLRWRGMWAVLVGGLGLAMPAVAQTEDKPPEPPVPIVVPETPLEEPARKPTLLPTLETLPQLPIVEKSVKKPNLPQTPELPSEEKSVKTPSLPQTPVTPPMLTSEDKPAKQPSRLPTPDTTPLVPVVPETTPLLDHSPAEGKSDPKAGAWIFDGEYLLMASRRPGQQYAIAGTSPVLGPIGEIKSVDGGNYHSGFRLGAGYRFPGEEIEVVFRYTFLHTADNQIANQPPNQLLFATETHPGLVVQVASASARSTVNLNVLDVELAKRFEISESLSGRVFAGPRFANLDQKFYTTYQGGDVNRDDVHRRLFFDGGGARAGGEVQFKFWEHFGTYFRGAGSLMTGRFRGDLSEVANNLPVVNVSEKFTRVVPNLEMALGLQYQTGGWRLSVGYEFSTWFDMVDGIDFVDDAHPAKLGRKTGNLSFDGIVFRSEYAF